MRSEIALAVHHQQQACKTIQQTEGELINKSFVVVGDGLSYVIVPQLMRNGFSLAWRK